MKAKKTEHRNELRRNRYKQTKQTTIYDIVTAGLQNLSQPPSSKDSLSLFNDRHHATFLSLYL